MTYFIIVNKMPFKEIIISEIEKTMNDYNKIYNIDYKFKTFDDYDKNFIKEINKKSNNKNIYFLNIKHNQNKNSILRKIKTNNKNSKIILTTKDNLKYLIDQEKYAYKILSENNTLKFRKSIYDIIKTFNIYNEKLLKLNVKENNVLHIINIDDIISITKNEFNKLSTIKTNNYTITTELDYTYLKEKLPNNFKDIYNKKIVNTDYIDDKILKQNLVVVSKHTRKIYDKNYKKTVVEKFKSGKLNKTDLKNMGIPLSTFRYWLKNYKDKNGLNIKIEIENK